MQVTAAERQAAASGQAPLVNPILFGLSIICQYNIWPLEIVLNIVPNQNGINGVCRLEPLGRIKWSPFLGNCPKRMGMNLISSIPLLGLFD